MKTLARWFVQGLLVLVPVMATVYAVWLVVTTMDGLIPIPIPGVGLLVTVVTIMLIGFVASSVVGKKLFDVIEAGMTRLPVVKLLYTSLRDLLQAFVGDQKGVGKPVVVDLDPERGLKVLGFLTCDHFSDPQLLGQVSVYLPQSYNFAGNLIVVPRARVRAIDADGAEFMAFVMSGGVTAMGAARTMLDQPVFGDRRSRGSVPPPR